ncbi:MAG: M1 family aminopeptidase [Bacteroidota bacterium]
MYIKILRLLLLFFSAADLRAQPVEKGVSYALALQRHALITRLSYQLAFDIPAEKTAKIIASATILFNLKNVQQPLQLDFRQDTMHVRSVTVNGRATHVDLRNEHLIIDKQFLVTGANTISIDFIAGNESLNRNNDYLYALFVPDRARTVFPCFDQPDLKANFLLKLTVPASWKVLANASVKDFSAAGEKTIYHFNESDLLPAYLFSFTAGNYSIADTSGMRFLYRETDTAKIHRSVDAVFKAHKDAIGFMESWTGIKFPFQKVGFVGIPSFQFGGMEHPGEVQYNSAALFLDDGATKDQLIARSALISHETAHMWFGDMVTMKWFNDVWMKEVFANFMADKVTEKLLGDETFNLKFLLDHTPAAYNVDRTPGANPIRQQLDNLQNAGSLYGNIIYHKAPIMMRQLESLMGKENFQKGVQEYLQKYKYGNAGWDDLIAILSRHTSSDLVKWNKVWVTRSGRPEFNYQLKNGKLIITQSSESGTAAVWPERFAVTIFYPGFNKIVDLNMTGAKVTLPLSGKPDFILFNSDGMGYGLFPAVINDELFKLQNPLQRASAYINAYENMLANHGVRPNDLLDFLIQGLIKETGELNLRTICGYIGNVFWNFLSPAQRTVKSAELEQKLWTALSSQTTSNNKKIIFRTYQDIYLSSEAGKKMRDIWQSQKAPDSVKLTEDDYTSLAITIALKTDTAKNVLEEQLVRITNPDRKARLQFLIPSLSPDSAIRDQFFNSLQDISKRRKEAWVAAALAYMNHPLRQKSFIKNLPKALDMLEEVQHSGDVFFPQNWLGAIFSNYQTTEVWKVVDTFLHSHPNYNTQLKAKIKQATDNLYRAQETLNK